MSKDCLNVLENHVSIRKFVPESIKDEDLQRIAEVANRAPTAWNLQPVLITIVRRNELKKEISKALGNQPHISQAPAIAVISIDLARAAAAAKEVVGETPKLGLGFFVEALISAVLTGAWFEIAAETLGYGVTNVAIYSDPCKVRSILRMNKGIIPVLGIILGMPAERPSKRPRAPPQYMWGIEEVPPLSGRKEALLRNIGNDASLIKMLFGSGGIYESVTRKIEKCLRDEGILP